MNQYIFKCQNMPLWTDIYPKPINWVCYNNGYHGYLDTEYPSTIISYPPIAASTPSIIGAWDIDGNILQIDLDAYLIMRPLGNDSGYSTDALVNPGWQGSAQVYLENHSYYPSTLAPFDIEVRHIELIGGWTWRAEMHGPAAARDPSVYAIAWYLDEACTQYVGTTGAFTQQISEWQVDDLGNPITVWATTGWDGDLRVSPATWNVALLYASLQHGHATLQESDTSIRFLFWENEALGSWVDSGSTWLSLIGANTMQVSNTAPFSAGSIIKIQDTTMTVSSIFTPGSPGILVVDLALPQFAVGDIIYINQ